MKAVLPGDCGHTLEADRIWPSAGQMMMVFRQILAGLDFRPLRVPVVC